MEHILIIDDSISVLKLLRALLEEAGYEVSEALNGKAGISLCHKEKVDVVITDIIMPDKEGLETIRELRQEFLDLKIIAISGGGFIEPDKYLRLAVKFGAQCTLSKPFTRNELLDALRKVVDGNARP